ncbi:MAG: ribonuclease HII [Halobacteriovoraceae bacterium]|nr:ribonuclease HII [Halobacteriovoraceae bacterium]|tara:strand:+ start:1412 stop:2086 length:675 start_codon:yes stop_codon:yes gene_type:complete
MSETLDSKYLETFEAVIGCDEVGRGPIAGPVVGCALKLKRSNDKVLQSFLELGVLDSKKLTTKKRLGILESLNINVASLAVNEAYEVEFQGCSFSFMLCEHSPSEIDQINILQASLSCMKKAASSLCTQEGSIVLIDGNKTFDVPGANVEPVVKGDSKLLSIGMASIIAKEFRDYKMALYDIQYPGYGLKKHAGYPTKAHKEALIQLGVTPIHRRSFKGVKELL